MGSSRLEKGLRAAAWTALIATVLALLGVSTLVRPAPSPLLLEVESAAAPGGLPLEEKE
jgi:hypothetical protein